MRQQTSTQQATEFTGQSYPQPGYALSYRIEVAGELVDIKAGSLKVKESIDHRTTCSFTIRDLDGSEHYLKGMPVVITDLSNETKVFAGVINSATESVISQTQGGLWHKIKTVGYDFYAGRRIAAQSYKDMAAGDIVTDLLNIYLSDEGITAGTIESGPIIHDTVVNYAYVDESYDSFAELADFIWYITPEKELNFHKRETFTAPFDADGTIAKAGSIDVKHANDKYRNRQYIRGGVNVTDTQTETRTGDGKKTTWTMAFPLATEPVITVGGVTQTVGIKGVETGKDWYWTKGENVISQDDQATPVASGTAIDISYNGLYNIIVLSTDQNAIQQRKDIEGGGSGWVDDIEDDPETQNSQAGFQHASALLKKYTKIGRTLKYRTRQPGLKAGMLQTANFPEHDLNGIDMLIQEVDISDQGPILWYDVTAVEGPVQESWAKWMGKGLSRPKVWVDKVNIGQEETLIVLVQETDNWTWTQTNAQTVFACPVPATDLYPSTSLVPC